MFGRATRKRLDRLQSDSKRSGLLAQFPEAAVMTDVRAVRRAVVQPYPYLIFYQLRAEELVVLSVRDARRRPVMPRAVT